jgi:catechol-2,3-dioxygenase
MKCKMDHIVLNVSDEARMIEFYMNVMELRPERVDEYRAGKVPFPSVRLNESTIIDLFPKRLWLDGSTNQSKSTNLNHFCVALTKSEWTRLIARLERNKTPIDVGPVQRWGARGAGTSVYFKDPEGNVIGARNYVEGHSTQDVQLGS